jgi:hypothetical protein
LPVIVYGNVLKSDCYIGVTTCVVKEFANNNITKKMVCASSDKLL